MATQSFPSCYNTYSLPDVKLAHHPVTSPTVTPIIQLILYRPKAHNAFTSAMCESLITALDLLSADPRVKVIVLTGSDASNRIFCAGMDLVIASSGQPQPAEPNPLDTRDHHRDGGGRVSLAMHRCGKPVIAAINGSAVGVGITMTLPANIRIVSNKAKVGFVFARRGFNLEACSSFFLPRLVGTSRAMHLVSTGGVYPAGHKLFDGLFSEVVEPEEVLPRALAVAEEIAGNVSLVAVKVMKEMIYRGSNSPEEAHLLESKLFWELFRGKDAKEGISSFMEKRPPNFQATMAEDAPSAYPWWTDVDVKVKAKI